MKVGTLTLGAPRQRGGFPGPAQPCLIPPLPKPPLTFPGLPALARHIHRQRAGRGLRLARTYAAHNGSDTFPAFKVWWVSDTGDEEYAFAVAIQTDVRETLEAALEANNPDIPAEYAA